MCTRCLVLFGVLGALLFSSGSAEIPQVISYQGKVTDNGGSPVADGDYFMSFTIYDDEASGSSQWSSGYFIVAVSSGVFSVLLGDTGQPTIDLEFDEDYWLEIDIEGDVQSPRSRLGSVCYAYMASGLVPGTEVVGSTSSPLLKATNSGTGAGLRGDSDQGTGVRGQTSATNGEGVLGRATATSGVNYGVYGETSSTDGFAGFFSGSTRVLGDLTLAFGGKVGIGVTSPGNPLVISGAESDTAGTGAQIRIHDSTNDNHAFAVRIGASGNQNLNLDSYWGTWQTLITVDRETGQVGLGTDTPDRDLSVVGYVRASNDVDETDYTEIYHGGGNGFINWNGDGNFEIRYANGAKVTVQQDGDMGIGTTNPGAKLDVRGSAVFNEDGGDYDFRVESDTRVNMLFVDASTDRVGIGTATPNAVLDVRGDVIVNEGGSDYDFRVEGDTEPNLLLVDAGTDRVGIGTTTPGATLDVRGSAVFNEDGGDNDFRVEGENDPNLLFADADLNCVGIGIGPSEAKLDVVAPYEGSGGLEFAVRAVNMATLGGGTCGVWGEMRYGLGAGVYGLAAYPSGFGRGGHFQSNSTAGTGVYGYASAGSGTTYGVYGSVGSASGYGVYYSGGLAGTGTKSCIVETSKGPTLLYCQESPENWFEDFGEGQLVDGRCHIELDPLFLETVTINQSSPMKVFVEHRGPCNGTYIETGTTAFDVIEQNGGMSNAGFCYRVVAKRKGFEQQRLDHCKAAETDAYLYPELRREEER